MPDTVSVQQIKNLIGEDAVKVLIEAYPKHIFYIPGNSNVIQFENTEERNEYIFNLSNSAKTYDYIAEKVGLSKGHIRKIVAEQIKMKRK